MAWPGPAVPPAPRVGGGARPRALLRGQRVRLAVAGRWRVRAGSGRQGLVGTAVPADHPGAARGGVPGRAGGAAAGDAHRGGDGGGRPGRRRGLLDPGPGQGPWRGRPAGQLVQPDDRAAPGQRDPAPGPAGRRRPRAADPAVGDPGNVEGMLDGVYPADEAHLGPVLEETAVMARLLDDLQTLSTAEAGVLRLHRERV